MRTIALSGGFVRIPLGVAHPSVAAAPTEHLVLLAALRAPAPKTPAHR